MDKDLEYLNIKNSFFCYVARPSSKAMVDYNYADHVWRDSTLDYNPEDNHFQNISREQMQAILNKHGYTNTEVPSEEILNQLLDTTEMKKAKFQASMEKLAARRSGSTGLKGIVKPEIGG